MSLLCLMMSCYCCFVICIYFFISDYGYHRSLNQDKCIEDVFFKGDEIDVCVRGHTEKLISEGYSDVFFVMDVCFPFYPFGSVSTCVGYCILLTTFVVEFT